MPHILRIGGIDGIYRNRAQNVGHPYPSKRQWLAAIRATHGVSHAAAVLAEYVVTQPVAGSPGEYGCNQSRAAQRLRMGTRTVSRGLAELRASGWLEQTVKGGAGHPAQYRLSAQSARQIGVCQVAIHETQQHAKLAT